MRRLRRSLPGIAMVLVLGLAPAHAQAPAAEPPTAQLRLLPGAEAPPAAGGPAIAPAVDIPTLPDPKADLAYGAYQRGLYVTALREATARLGGNPDDAVAMTLLGELYAQGLGVAQDPGKAADWYRLAHAKGNADATFALAMLTLQGRGATKDEKAGLALLEEAAGKGHPLASYNLAVVLIGRGKPEDMKRAATLVTRAAEMEVADAQYALAVLMREGRGVNKDPVEAAIWMSRAAGNGHIAAQVEYAIMLFNGEGTTRDETAAARLFASAAARGNAIAQNRLARILAAGRGLPRNLVEAASWHILAAGQGLADTWLDDALKGLTPAERQKAEDLARRRSNDLALIGN
ncbi:tetratricopeptide repeat protein [Chelatococcus sp. SYSU_G07232]|uniref:Tetratricopeptide repeat protein n=1 Tax=Chelatococcus albus TaxID=3047466 RepID=A0ABT7AI18_9HYPH|nr:tetratricopeptide repeat protein [Chelatococcus sp. SYSU_G07232]MDJ1158261.1 tetratricopeptide repeat protein [Chelatococcus sp. SYSU_G07232]